MYVLGLVLHTNIMQTNRLLICPVFSLSLTIAACARCGSGMVWKHLHKHHKHTHYIHSTFSRNEAN